MVRFAWSGERNLVFNGSFSSSLDGWLPWQATLVRIRHGDHKTAVRVVSTGRTVASSVYTVYTFPRPVVDLVPGATFTADASVRSDHAGRRICLMLRKSGRPTETCSGAELHDRINALARFTPLPLHVAQAW